MIRVARRTAFAWLGVLLASSVSLWAGYEEGLNAFKAKDYKRAIEEFSAEIEKHPNYDYGHFMLGMSYLKLNQLDKAIPRLERAAELDKEKLVYHYNLAQAYRQAGKWDKVVATLEGKTELRARPNENANAHYLLGLGYLNAKRFVDAVEQLEAGKKLAPKDPRILSSLGTAQFYNGDYDNAVTNLKASIALDAKDVPTNRFLGESLIAQAQRATDKAEKKRLYTEAAKYAEQANKQDGGTDFDTVYLTGRAYLGAERYAQAVEALNKALSTKPKHAYAHYNQGEAYKGLDDWASAEKEYVKATELKPDNATFFTALGYTYEQLAKQNEGQSLEDAMRCYEISQKLKPKTSTRDAIARVTQNLEIREENRRIAEENTRIEEKNKLREEEYAKQVEEAKKYEEARKRYMEDKGIRQKDREAGTGSTPSPEPTPEPTPEPEPSPSDDTSSSSAEGGH